MRQNNSIKLSSLDDLKRNVQIACERRLPVRVCIKTPRSKAANYDVIVVGVYPKFFTVKNETLNVSFTVAFVDVATGNVGIEINALENS